MAAPENTFGPQLRMARYGLGLTARNVIKHSGVSSVPLTKAETNLPVTNTTLTALINFYRTLGVEFGENGSVTLTKGEAPEEFKS